MTMHDHFNVSGMAIQGTLHLIPISGTPDGYATFETPLEQCALDAGNEVLGSAILRAAERCRRVQRREDLGGTDPDDVARSLGYKSDKEICKRVASVAVSRRRGETTLIINATRPERGIALFTSDKFEAPIDDPAELGRVVKLAVAISEANLLSMLEKRAKRKK
ncbi:MAG: hypothetical protein REI09_10075 [Candidatus Dactylopiibacterium sp.]|nr:hypothetical protein [Candidatus Dactylopiibacterium sp.]